MTFNILGMNKNTEMVYCSQEISGCSFLVQESYNIAFKLSLYVIFFLMAHLRVKENY